MIEKRVHLREVTDKEFASFILYSSEHQAACLKKEKGISAEEAYVETEEELNKMLPNGKNTPGNFFMAICTQDDSVVGYMWYMHDNRREDTFLFLCDFHILQEERRKGYGSRLGPLEVWCRMDCSRLRQARIKEYRIHAYGDSLRRVPIIFLLFFSFKP